MIDFFHYREQADERPFTTRARPGMARRESQKHCRKGRKNVYNFVTVTFAEAWHLNCWSLGFQAKGSLEFCIQNLEAIVRRKQLGSRWAHQA
jgi:hypothetical protein